MHVSYIIKQTKNLKKINAFRNIEHTHFGGSPCIYTTIYIIYRYKYMWSNTECGTKSPDFKPIVIFGLYFCCWILLLLYILVFDEKTFFKV